MDLACCLQRVGFHTAPVAAGVWETDCPAGRSFMKGRHISNNIWLVLDILDNGDLVEKKLLILFLDFYKAFHTVKHSFIFEAL